MDEPHPTVIFLVLASGLGGSIRSLATALQGMAGIRRVVASPAGSATARLALDRGLAERLVDLPTQRRSRVLHRLRIAARVAGTARQERAHLTAIHANGLSELTVALPAALVGGCRLVVWVHEWAVPPWVRRLSPVLRMLSRWIRFAAVSEASQQMVAAAGLVPADKVTIVANPVDPGDVCSPRRRDPIGPVEVAFLGAPAAYKGFHFLPSLVMLTSDLHVRWTVYSGPELEMSEVFADLRALGVELPGKVPDVRAVYGSCDLVVIPSLRESFGRVAAEAMANGLPVVASDLPAMREVLGDSEAGLLVPPGNHDAYAEAIRRLAMDAGLRQQLGEAGVLRSARFHPEPVVRSLLALYGVQNDSSLER